MLIQKLIDYCLFRELWEYFSINGCCISYPMTIQIYPILPLTRLPTVSVITLVVMQSLLVVILVHHALLTINVRNLLVTECVCTQVVTNSRTNLFVHHKPIHSNDNSNLMIRKKSKSSRVI